MIWIELSGSKVFSGPIWETYTEEALENCHRRVRYSRVFVKVVLG
jgi:hypothetical protein